MRTSLIAVILGLKERNLNPSVFDKAETTLKEAY